MINPIPAQSSTRIKPSPLLPSLEPITPLFTVYQAAKVARADERIAIAKAATPVAKIARRSELAETYFKLPIAQRRLTEAEGKVSMTHALAEVSTAPIDDSVFLI